ncbi:MULTISPECIES: TIGR01906 family membrane protein [Clostridium]|uniref:TIGR01906 family membrane protein n=1 Tax=Clostridium TaxID=1485 RepID=UPI0008269D4D|nr:MULTISPECIES: TIGR01906 family membrane protein [Clostridium]PJI09375.1 TIGR01906 family membrane protein [Clostridium sp. CT7]
MFKISYVLEILLSILVSLFIFLIIIKFTISLKPLYYYDIKALNITSNFNNDIGNYSDSTITLNEKQVKEDYDYMISYINGSNRNYDFNLPNLPSSKHGKIHFKDVKNLITKINKVMIFVFFPTLIGIILCSLKKRWRYLKISSIELILTPILIIVLSLKNFSTAFDKFHELFFNNNYWVFNPKYDPVILLLPEKFFFHCFALIISLCLFSGGILLLIYKKRK